MYGSEPSDAVETLISRLELLDRFCRSPAHIRDITDETGHSRSTVHRAVNELTELGVVTRTDDGIEATITGRIARDQLTSSLADFDDILKARAVLEPLPAQSTITSAAIAGAETILAEEPTPYRPADRFHEALADATTFRAVLPTLEESRTIRVLYEHVVTRENRAELVVSQAVFETLRTEFPRRMAVLAESDHCAVHVSDVPEYTLGVLEHRPTPGAERTTSVHVVVHNDSGGIHGLLVNETERAVSWARDLYERCRRSGTDRTEELLADVGENTEVNDQPGRGTCGHSLPVSLERAGFVTIGASYFQNEPVAKPATAWRAELSPAEVHVGYAVAREAQPTVEESTTDAAELEGVESDGRDSGIGAELAAELGAGTNAIVLGPPGSGKSTICKQVACRWYADDRGPVFYRDGTTDRSVDAVDDFVAHLRSVEGHALVVVEDATRADAEAVFELLERVDHREDVSVLLDAREHEWRTFTDQRASIPDLAVVHVPPLRAADCERFVDHFERTVGRPVEPSAADLWAAIREDPGDGDEQQPHELLRLVHRLSTYADPLAEDATALEETVASVYASLAEDELALSVGLLANTLIAAGIGTVRGLLYAVGDADDLGAVENALETVHGQVLFPREDGGYRTVHEDWATAFLHHHRRVAGSEDASERFGAILGALLSLANDPARCEQIASHLGEPTVLEPVTEAPAEWVTATVDAVYALGERRSQLAPLFGDGHENPFELPDACPEPVVLERHHRLGDLFLAGGYYDRAETAFERASSDRPDHAIERLLGLARVAFNRGEYDEVIDHCRTCLSRLESDDETLDRETRATLRARTRVRLGEGLAEKGEYDEAASQYERALLEFRDRNDRGWESKTRQRIADLAFQRGEYDDAADRYESCLKSRRELGDRRGEAELCNSLGNVAWQQGDFDRAGELFERTLEIQTAVGDRHAVASVLNNLGAVELMREHYGKAAEFFERSLEDSRAVGDQPGVAKCLHNLGRVHEEAGEFDRATEYYERSLEIKRDLGDRPLLTTSVTTLGTVEGRRGNYGRAAEYQERALELTRELGDRHGTARCLHNLGQINHRQGNFEEAVECYEDSLAIKEAIGDRGDLVPSFTNLATIAAKRGEHDRARAYADRGLEVAMAVDISDQLAGSYLCQAEIALRTDADDRAENRLERALSAVETEDGLLGLEIRLAMARLARLRGNHERASSIAGEVRTGAERLDAAYWVAQADRLLGELHLESGSPADAHESLDRALEYFERAGAVRYALSTLETLLEMKAVDDDARARYLERGRALLTAAPEDVSQRHAAWLSDTSGR
ncbi:tetratricopeptide repeat protein [Natronobeatus ordinarius]|uniref:tetratricopeptide repeat protein n=1 Tax=Natronobeatus ordinarius TaxID=2963433 RepID=UPI0020CFB1DB|nr:tetratricopeptide repeat protein [Natronobeatus ordinarius]